jgi:hypothetical protein
MNEEGSVHGGSENPFRLCLQLIESTRLGIGALRVPQLFLEGVPLGAVSGFAFSHRSSRAAHSDGTAEVVFHAQHFPRLNMPSPSQSHGSKWRPPNGT